MSERNELGMSDYADETHVSQLVGLSELIDYHLDDQLKQSKIRSPMGV